MKNVLITGAAGFIGSNYVRLALQEHPEWTVLALDKMTYAGNLDNLKDVAEQFKTRYSFVQADIADREAIFNLIKEHKIDTIVNFAAESHVDRSILDPDAFIMTDVYGTYVLLEAAREFKLERFHQVSTDEVYGDIPEGYSKETDPLEPNSPYSASKASAELLIRSYRVTYNLPITITRGSNTFGPFQYPEKLLPLFITNAIDDLPLPLYGDGMQMRDWLHVVDHAKGVDVALTKGTIGEAYNVGGENEQHNIDVIRMMLRLLGKPESLIKQVVDRPGHDRRYALDTAKLRKLGWAPRGDFEKAMRETIDWYVNNEWWWRKIKTGEFKEFYKKQYEERLRLAAA